jgi:hypothetical protein
MRWPTTAPFSPRTTTSPQEENTSSSNTATKATSVKPSNIAPCRRQNGFLRLRLQPIAAIPPGQGYRERQSEIERSRPHPEFQAETPFVLEHKSVGPA